MYTLLAKPTVEKDLRSIRAEDLADLNDKIKSLAEQPRQHKTEKLKGVEAKTVTIHRVQHRKEVYR